VRLKKYSAANRKRKIVDAAFIPMPDVFAGKYLSG
jgi:hypothetical protein